MNYTLNKYFLFLLALCTQQQMPAVKIIRKKITIEELLSNPKTNYFPEYTPSKSNVKGASSLHKIKKVDLYNNLSLPKSRISNALLAVCLHTYKNK